MMWMGIIIIAATAILTFATWCVLKAAGDADRATEMMKKRQEED